MGKINRMRVYLGGLIAGIFIYLCEFVLQGMILGADWKAATTALGKTPTAADQSSSMVLFGVWALVVGVAASWVYAAIRPRYGPGPGTAIRGGLWVWIMASFCPGVINMAIKLFPQKLITVQMVGELIIVVLASMIAGALYKEAA